MPVFVFIYTSYHSLEGSQTLHLEYKGNRIPLPVKTGSPLRRRDGLYYRGLALDAYSKIITALDVERVRVEMLTELSTKLARACSDARNSLAYVNHNYPDVSDRGARSERIENCSLALETAREVLDTY